MKNKAKKAQKTKSSDYLPIPEPKQDESMLDKVMGYSYPDGPKYPVDAKMQETGTYAPYTTGTKMREEERRIQDELLSKQLEFMSRDPSSMKADPQVEAVMGAYQSDPSYPEPSKYGSDPFYPKRPMHQAPQTYYDAPFERTPVNADKEPGYVPERSPYRLAPGVASPLGTTPNEARDMEEAIQKAMGGAARAGAAKGNSVKFRR